MKPFFFFIFIFVSFSIFSQNTEGFSYQSTIRNSNNQLVINQYISLRFTIRLNSNAGATVYSEIQYPYSNSNGNVNLIIGKGIATSGTFSTINWAAGTHYLGIEFFTGTTSCQWIIVPIGTNGQIVSYCNGIYTWGSCTPQFPNLVWSDAIHQSLK
jgi:hypothetical protein